MNKGGGMGGGSASIILIFAVLCLTVFTLIAFVVSGNEKALVDTEVNLVKSYYEADALAERILTEILESVTKPESVEGITIDYWTDLSSGADMATWSCPFEDDKELFVSLAFNNDSYNILNWKMRNTGRWEIDDSLDLWLGDDESGFLFLDDNPGALVIVGED